MYGISRNLAKRLSAEAALALPAIEVSRALPAAPSGLRQANYADMDGISRNVARRLGDSGSPRQRLRCRP
jgi:hypothetical protein